METKHAFLTVIEIYHLDNVLWEVVGSLYLRVEIKMGHLSKRCALSGTDLMTPPPLEWGCQNVPVGHIVPQELSAVNISLCIHSRGNIADSTSTGSSSTVSPSQEKINRVEENTLWVQAIDEPHRPEVS